MARDQHKMMLPDTWTELTAGDAATITFQVLSGQIEVRGRPDGTPPAASESGLRYVTGAGELAVSMNILFARGDCVRLFGRSVKFQSEVLIDHG